MASNRVYLGDVLNPYFEGEKYYLLEWSSFFGQADFKSEKLEVDDGVNLYDFFKLDMQLVYGCKDWRKDSLDRKIKTLTVMEEGEIIKPLYKVVFWRNLYFGESIGLFTRVIDCEQDRIGELASFLQTYEIDECS